MTEERAEQVRRIAELAHGRVVARNDDVMTIEVPADVSIGLHRLWGQGGFAVQFRGQTTRAAPRRVTNTNGQTIVCEGDLVTTAFYTLDVQL
ncbi:hypothetical protein ACQR1Y_12405 [Bradyrhizobium sp. HKCCYLRH3099]|uniref:hypothetical protein n=1 Tax=Bradyrhizobium TaxID=374 RepID=UPI003EBEBC66